MAVRLGLQPHCRQETWPTASRGRLEAVDGVLDAPRTDLPGRGGSGDLDPVELKVFDRDRTIVYSDAETIVGTTSGSDELREALAGQVVSGFAHSADDDAASKDGDPRLLEVYVPL